MVRLRNKIPDEKVATRIKQMFFLQKPEAFDSQVENFLSKRNLILHEGDLETIQWYDIIFAKQLYEEILEQLMRFCYASLDLDWIESYYDLAGKPVTSLDETRKAVEFLIKQKSQKLSPIHAALEAYKRLAATSIRFLPQHGSNAKKKRSHFAGK